MKDLTDTTFITVVKIESEDRYNNAKSVLGYLNKNFKTNVLIYELASDTPLDFLDDFENLNIKKYYDIDSKIFHRTKFLNILLKRAQTPVVANYDIDVVLPVLSYVISQGLILNNKADVVYPFPDGERQVAVSQETHRDNFKEFDLSKIHNENYLRTYCGHAFFANTLKYKEFGGENENFLSYGPEDKERLIRFEKLGGRIKRIEAPVYHLEHSRGHDSDASNKFFDKNNEEFTKIKNMSAQEIKKYLPPIE